MLANLLLSKPTSLYITLILSILLTLHCGTIYSYSAFSKTISNILDSKNVAIIGSIGDVGFFLSLIMGYLYHYTNNIYNITLIVSILLITLGWLLQYIYINFYFWCFCYFLIGLGSSGTLLTVITFNSYNFPTKNRGLIIGILFAGVGFSGIIWTTLFKFLYNYDLYKMLITLGISTLSFGIISYFFLQTKLREIKTEKSSLEHQDFTYPTKTVTHQFDPNRLDEESYFNIEITNADLLDKRLFWLLFVTIMINCGIVLSWKNHIGLLGLDLSNTIHLVLAFVITNACSRFIIGLLSDYLISYMSRPIWILITSVFSTINLTIFVSYPTVETLYLITITLAIVYGTTITINSQIVTLCFGVKHYGINHGYLNLGIAIGSFSISAITTSLHDIASRHNNCDSTNPMLCFRYPIMFSLFLSVCPIITSILIWLDYPPKWLIPSNEQRRRSSLSFNDPDYLPINKQIDIEENDNLLDEVRARVVSPKSNY